MIIISRKKVHRFRDTVRNSFSCTCAVQGEKNELNALFFCFFFQVTKKSYKSVTVFQS